MRSAHGFGYAFGVEATEKEDRLARGVRPAAAKEPAAGGWSKEVGMGPVVRLRITPIVPMLALPRGAAQWIPTGGRHGTVDGCGRPRAGYFSG